jgi:hypothetical protein
LTSLYTFNKERDSGQKINWFFTDRYGNWDEVSNHKEWAAMNFRAMDRDSITATNVISIYEKIKLQDKQNKLLVIYNTRHAYRVNRGGLELTTADYLYKKYKSKIGFVWINGQYYKLGVIMSLSPYSGLLDAATLKMKDSIWAISFDESILGKEKFYLLPALDCRKYQMKDLFDGMIYYLPPSKQYKKSGYEYILDDFSETLLKRSAIVGEDYLKGSEKMIKFYKEENSPRKEPYISNLPFNFIFYLIHYSILLYLLFSLIRILKKQSTKNIHD